MAEFRVPAADDPAPRTQPPAGAIQAELQPVPGLVAPSGTMFIAWHGEAASSVPSLLPSGVAHAGTLHSTLPTPAPSGVGPFVPVATLVATVQAVMPSGVTFTQVCSEYLREFLPHIPTIIIGALAYENHLNGPLVELTSEAVIAGVTISVLLHRPPKSGEEAPSASE